MRGFFPFPFGCAQGQGQNDNPFLVYSNYENALALKLILLNGLPIEALGLFPAAERLRVFAARGGPRGPEAHRPIRRTSMKEFS
jgi:hypothetical protein